jgi:hypothetical protein
MQVKYVRDGEEQHGLLMTSLNLMDKTFAVWGAMLAQDLECGRYYVQIHAQNCDCIRSSMEF